ncbi:MAG: lipopolysaccharide kinase InaA family protein [Verrucomicrobiota bacterium]
MDDTLNEQLGSLDLLFWSELKTRWPSLPFPLRRQLLRQVAETSYRLWLEGADLRSMPLDLLAIQACGRPPDAHMARNLVRTLPVPLPPAEVLDMLANWYSQTGNVLTPREGRFFMKAFMQLEPLDSETVRHTANHVGALAFQRLADRARRVYRNVLRTEVSTVPKPGGRLRGRWEPDLRLSAAELAAAITQAEDDPSAAVIKDSNFIRVIRAPLLGRDALIKRYDLRNLAERLKYIVRASRARRAWAAAQSLVQLEVPTPEPLGFLEVCAGPIPVRSYFVTAFVADACNAAKWLKRQYARQAPEVRESLRSDLLQCLLDLYRKGVYHGDTKTSNILLRAPADPARRAFFWIDLEGVQFGKYLTRYKILRNLVQLNGSLGTRVSDEDRLAFLHDMARHYPWVTRPRVVRRIREWTRRRLLNELRLRCGS